MSTGGAAAPSAEAGNGSAFPLAWVGFVLVAVGTLEVTGWWLSHALFRRYLREYFLEHPPNLETDMALTQELGELFGIPSTGDDTVQGYLLRVRAKIGLSGAKPASRHPVGDAAFRSMGPEEGLV